MSNPTRRIPTAPLAFVVCGVAAAVANGWFQSTVARRFGTDDAGASWSLSVVLSGLGLVGLGAQVVVARAGQRPTPGWPVAALAGFALGSASWLATPGPLWYRTWVAVLMAVAGVVVMVGVPTRAALLQHRRWGELGLVYLVGSLVRSATLPLIAVTEMSGLLAALVSSVLGEVAVVLAALVLARRATCRPIPPTQPGGSPTLHRLVGPAVALIGLWAITTADGVVARLSLAPNQADSYAVASSTARAGFFLALLLTHLALPSLTQSNERSTTLHAVVNRTYLAIAAVEAPVVAAVLIWPQRAVELVAPGSAIAVDSLTVRVLAVAWALIGVIPLATYAHLARPSRLSMAPLAAGGVVLVVGSMANTATGLATVLACTVAATALVTVVVGLQRLRPITRAARWEGVPAPTAGTQGAIAVVVPFYNPGPTTLQHTIDQLERSLMNRFDTYRIIAVSDGSDDGSYEALAERANPSLIAVALPANRGKGAALRHGLALAHEPLLAYIDADGDLPPDQLADYVLILTDTKADVVLASKQHPSSQLSVAAHRTVMSQVFRYAVRVAFRLDVADTQTGLKVFRRELVEPLLPLLREDGFAFDVELLVAARARRNVVIVEAPVVINRQSGSTVSLRRSVDTAAGLFRILWRRHVVGAYADQGEPS